MEPWKRPPILRNYHIVIFLPTIDRSLVGCRWNQTCRFPLGFARIGARYLVISIFW